VLGDFVWTGMDYIGEPGVGSVRLDNNGKILATKSLRTAGPARKVRLTIDRAAIRADRNDLAYVTVETTDAASNVLPDATNLVHFKLSGPGELAAVGSGAPNVLESFRRPQHTAWHGRCLAILRPLGSTAKLTLRAEADGLSAADVIVRVKHPRALRLKSFYARQLMRYVQILNFQKEKQPPCI
jgi:beta-galactosidase